MTSVRSNSNLSPEYLLLGLLALQPAHGYALHQRLSTDLGHIWRISLSQTYNILKRLESQGLLCADEEAQDSLPPRRSFRLTDAGRAHFNTWLQSTVGCSTRAIRIEFLTRLYFVEALAPEHLLPLLEQQIEVVRHGVAKLQELLAALPPEQTYNRLSLDLRIRQLEPMLNWLLACKKTWQAAGSLTPLVSISKRSFKIHQ